MKITLIPNGFKSTLTARQICDILSDVLLSLRSDIQIEKIPLADGGDGTVDVFKEKVGAKTISLLTQDPFLKNKIQTKYCIVNSTAILSTSTSSGLAMVEGREDVKQTSSYALGEQILDALNRGIRNFTIGLGGSATNDCGCGMLSALGMKFYDSRNKDYIPTGISLMDCRRIDSSSLDSRLNECRFTLLSDVANPLLGEKGSTYVFAKQKGAKEEELPMLEEGMKHISELMVKDRSLDFKAYPGSGAAGGIAFACLTFLHAELKEGVQEIMKLEQAEERMKGSDLIITGEGKIDESTLYGKGVMEILRYAKKHHIKVLLIGGFIEENIQEEMKKEGATYLLSIEKEKHEISYLKQHAEEHLRKESYEFLKEIIETHSLD